MGSPLRLLPRADLIQTGPVDHADWNYKFPLSWISRSRIRMVVRMLPARVGRILEIGYGSGIVLPEYAGRCDELHGIDPHPYHREVTASLRRHAVIAALVSGTAEQLPYAAGYFDRVVSVSALEFVPDAAAACREIARVLAPEGRFLIVTPGHSRVVDFGLKMMAGTIAKQDYGDKRQRLLPTLFEHFRPLRRSKFPPLLGAVVPLYRAFELTPRE
ncbi:class I SAM-dependent methyltransferase [Limnoglobus roseus]|uniref:Class I SAM-dependent methyltransferase n=1 Tax=Limnoglobus roseus TaxID=2598579 RepID=A0A5C1AS51_9BACT|nr:class I SAM-dependent methyltransferase [Limnoglobus roseus]QEL20977.1 class I SAM-dependent methyltransferase [Limnoglobus roseus]